MIYTEEDLEQAYAIGYNEAVDDVNEYAEQEFMEFSLDDDYSSYDEDYSAVEDMIYNESPEYGSPEWVKRHGISNDLRIIRKAGVDPKNVKTKDDYKRLSIHDKIRLRDAVKKNEFLNGGEMQRAMQKYNTKHAKNG